MKKLVSIILIAAFCAALPMLLSGCKSGGGQVVDIRTPVPDPVIVDTPTDVPEVTPEPTSVPTPIPTEPAVTEQATEQATEQNETPAPTQGADVTPDQSVFDDAVFIGNSIFEGLYRFGIITHGRFYTKVGLNVNSVMTDHAEGSSVPVIDELNGGEVGKVIILLGTNELGWPSYPTFIQKYSDLLDAVWQRQPKAKIYVTALPPVTKNTSDTSTVGITNSNIVRMNGMLEELAGRKGAIFIDVPASLYDGSGALPDEASSDGIHLNLKYDRLWADHITLKVMGAI